MNALSSLRVAIVLTLAVLVSACSGGRDTVQAHQARIRLLPAPLPLAGYLTVHNGTGDTVRLIGAHSADFGHVMLHRSVQQNGQARMQEVDGVDVPPGTDLVLRPGGLHLMLMHRRHALAAGDRLTVTLQFASGTQVPVQFVVRPATEVD